MVSIPQSTPNLLKKKAHISINKKKTCFLYQSLQTLLYAETLLDRIKMKERSKQKLGEKYGGDLFK